MMPMKFLCLVLAVYSTDAVNLGDVGKPQLGLAAAVARVDADDSKPHLGLAAAVARVDADASLAKNVQFAVGALGVAEERATEKAMSNMTMAEALKIFAEQKGVPADVKALIQKQLHNETQPGYSGVQKGQDMLNEMIQETIEKLDLERQTCASFIETSEGQIATTSQDIRTFDARAAGAKEDVLNAQTNIERLSKLLPQLAATLVAHNTKCADDIAGLNAQLAIVVGDIAVMGNVLKMIGPCEAAFLQHDGPVLEQVSLRTEVSTIKSEDSRMHLREGLDEVCPEDLIPLEQPSLSDADAFLQEAQGPVVPVTKEEKKEVPPPKKKGGCKLGKKACKRLKAKFTKIQSGIMGKRDELTAELLSVEKHCKEQKESLETQISDAEADLKGHQTALAKGTKEQNDAERNSKLKNEERTALNAELDRMTKLCTLNINALVSEKCALGKIRGELEKMKGHTNPAFLQDCEVTDWAAGDCSVSCGGGTQKLTRAISVHPVGGAPCPPLEMERKCSEEQCPVDCVMEDWTEWGDCSAKCNSGIKQKIRNVVTTAQFGGEPCGESSIAESCNIGSCDKDCVLGEWSVWSACSKACDSGLRTRVKGVLVKPEGAGVCPAKDVAERMEYQLCNEQWCPREVTCDQKLDLLVLIDSSSGLGKNGWAQMQNATEQVLKTMYGHDDNVRVSVISYSGPATFDEFDLCTGGTDGTPDMVKDCGIEIVQHFTSDMKAAADVVKGLKWVEKTSLTSQALMTAKAEMMLGRKGATAVTLVLSYGQPMNSLRTEQAAKGLRSVSRLVWVQVANDKVPDKELTKWASVPTMDNLIKVEDFTALSAPETVVDIVASTCREVTSACPAGYALNVGDIPGWGKGEGMAGKLPADLIEDCAEQCDATKGCLSFEWSATNKYACNLNDVKDPSGAKFEDFVFCSKVA